MSVVERRPRASQGGRGRAFSQWRGDIPEDSFLPGCGVSRFPHPWCSWRHHTCVRHGGRMLDSRL